MARTKQNPVHIQTAKAPGAQDPKKVQKLKAGGKVAFRDHPFSFTELMAAAHKQRFPPAAPAEAEEASSEG